MPVEDQHFVILHSTHYLPSPSQTLPLFSFLNIWNCFYTFFLSSLERTGKFYFNSSIQFFRPLILCFACTSCPTSLLRQNNAEQVTGQEHGAQWDTLSPSRSWGKRGLQALWPLKGLWFLGGAFTVLTFASWGRVQPALQGDTQALPDLWKSLGTPCLLYSVHHLCLPSGTYTRQTKWYKSLQKGPQFKKGISNL